MNKSKLITGALIVGLAASGLLAVTTYSRWSSSAYSSKVSIPKDVVNVKSEITSQPSGFGVKRELTGQLKEQSKKSMGDINFSDVGTGSFEIVGKLVEDKEKIYSLIKKEDKNYTSTIDWTYLKNITVDDYKALMVVCGQITEDGLNKDQYGRYTVETNIPDEDKLKEADIQVLYDVDEEGCFTLWTDMVTRDSKESNEIEELKSFKLYYDGNMLKIK